MNKHLCSFEAEDRDGLKVVASETEVFVKSKNLIKYCLKHCEDIATCLKKGQFLRHLDSNEQE